MPSRKQRRRRQKALRHEYEFVYVDEEGREVEGASEEAAPAPAKRDGRSSAPARRPPPRTVPPPSWRRVAKRALVFAPFMYVTLTLIARDQTPLSRVVQTVILLAFFLPFSYVMDSVMYRTYLRRGGKPPAEASKTRAQGEKKR
jgi:hypothetical protein